MKNLKLFLLLNFIFYSFQIDAMASTRQEEFRVAIQQNNRLKVQNFLNDKDIDVNFVYSDNKNPFYISLENLETQVNQSLSTKIAIAVVTGLSSLIAGPKLGKDAKRELNNFLEIKNKAPDLIKQEREKNDVQKVRDILGLGKELETKLNIPHVCNNPLTYSKNLLINVQKKGTLDDITKALLVTQLAIEHVSDQKIIHDPAAYRREQILRHGSQMAGYFLTIMGLIIGTFGLIWKSTKIYKSIMDAQKIALLIRNHPKFKQDLQSAEFIRKTFPKYMNLLKVQ